MNTTPIIPTEAFQSLINLGYSTSLPLLYHALDWLRLEKKVYISAIPTVGKRWSFNIADLASPEDESDWIERELFKDGYPVFDTFEEALNKAIVRYCNLISSIHENQTTL